MRRNKLGESCTKMLNDKSKKFGLRLFLLDRIQKRLPASLAFFHDVLVELLIEGNGIVARVARRAKYVCLSAGGFDHAVQAEIADAVGAKIGFDLHDR